jgi:hypothetical protein
MTSVLDKDDNSTSSSASVSSSSPSSSLSSLASTTAKKQKVKNGEQQEQQQRKYDVHRMEIAVAQQKQESASLTPSPLPPADGLREAAAAAALVVNKNLQSPPPQQKELHHHHHPPHFPGAVALLQSLNVDTLLQNRKVAIAIPPPTTEESEAGSPLSAVAGTRCSNSNNSSIKSKTGRPKFKPTMQDLFAPPEDKSQTVRWQVYNIKGTPKMWDGRQWRKICLFQQCARYAVLSDFCKAQ